MTTPAKPKDPGTPRGPESAVTRAARAIKRGSIVALPTETVYGLAVKSDRLDAVEKIYKLKGRDWNRPLQVLLPKDERLNRWSGPNRAASVLAARFWPGPLTLVVRAWMGVPKFLTREGTVGLRVPRHPVALELLELAGPLAATSANKSGELPIADVAHMEEAFGDSVAVYLDGGHIVGLASTVVDVTGSRPRVLREGAIPSDEITTALSRAQFEPQ
jgi:L-threonylcarbamoyladenylate synthase